MIKHPGKLIFLILATSFLLSSCVDLSHKPSVIPQGLQTDDLVTRNYEHRTWFPPSELDFDPIGLAKIAEVPINNARTKIIGPAYEDALDSLGVQNIRVQVPPEQLCTSLFLSLRH